MKERKDIRDCHYGCYPAVTVAILGLIATGMYLEIELFAKRKIVVENYNHFFKDYRWDDHNKCFSYYGGEENAQMFNTIKSYAAQAENFIN